MVNYSKYIYATKEQWHQAYFRSMRRIMGLGTGIIVGIHLVPNLLPELKPRVFNQFGMASKLDGEVPAQMERVIGECCEKLNVDRSRLQFCYSADRGWSTGATSFWNGAMVALPPSNRYFAFETTNDALNEIYSVYKVEKSYDWNSSTGKQWLKSQLPTEEHLRFELARQLIRLKNYVFAINGAFTLGWFYSFYRVGMFLIRLPAIPMSTTVMIHLIGGLFTFGLYRQVYRELKKWEEYELDRRVASLGEEYQSAGLACIRHEMKRNRIFMRLDPLYAHHFTEKGDFKDTDINCASFSSRLKLLKSYGPSHIETGVVVSSGEVEDVGEVVERIAVEN